MSRRIFDYPIFILLASLLLIGAFAPAFVAGAEGTGICSESCRKELSCSHTHASPFRCCMDEDETATAKITVRPAVQKRPAQKSPSSYLSIRRTKLQDFLGALPGSGVPDPLARPISLTIIRTVVLLN